MKKLCVCFGNCQVAKTHTFLEEFTDFSETYDTQIFANWQMINVLKSENIASQKSILFFQLVQEADLILYQPLRDEHGCFSSNPENPDSFIKLIKPDCKIISMPRLCCQYFFPIIHKKQHSSEFYGNILNCPDSLEQLIEMYGNGTLEFDIKERVKKNYEIGKQKEEFTDCKIVDFIYNLISKRRIFHTQDHPATIIYTEIVRQIADILELKYDHSTFLKIANENDNYAGHLDSIYEREDNQYPFSNYIIKTLGLSFAMPETLEVHEFYRSILTHWFLVNKMNMFRLTYPYIRTIPQGVAYLQET
jgi:hypothetical protein